MLALAVLLVAMASVARAADTRSGSFRGASGHSTSGSVTVTQSGASATLQLGADFMHDGAPDPWIAFGRDGSYIDATRFSTLNANAGAQTYQVPSGIDLSTVNEVYIWCLRYSVPLGVARLR